MYKKDLALNKLKELICHKTTKQSTYFMSVYSCAHLCKWHYFSKEMKKLKH